MRLVKASHFRVFAGFRQIRRAVRLSPSPVLNRLVHWACHSRLTSCIPLAISPVHCRGLHTQASRWRSVNSTVCYNSESGDYGSGATLMLTVIAESLVAILLSA